MDIKEFYGIGIVEVFWRYDEFNESCRKAFIEIYIPNVKGLYYGQQYCIKYSFLENDNVINEEIFESSKLNLSYKKIDNDLYDVSILSERHKLNKNQLSSLINIINKREKNL